MREREMRMRSRARSNNPSQIITPQRRRRSTWCRIRAKTYSRLGREREGKGREGERDLPGGGGGGGGGGESCPGDEGRRGESN
jgi:hypothetical protein